MTTSFRQQKALPPCLPIRTNRKEESEEFNSFTNHKVQCSNLNVQSKMNYQNLFKIAIRAIAANKMRSFLTALEIGRAHV